MRSTRENKELRYYFCILSNLAAAVRDAAQDDIEFHIGELTAMQMHTTSDALRRKCRASISGFVKPIAAIHA